MQISIASWVVLCDVFLLLYGRHPWLSHTPHLGLQCGLIILKSWDVLELSLITLMAHNVFCKPPDSWIIIIIICMCLAKSLIGKFQNETMLHKKKPSSHFLWKKKLKTNQSTANTCVRLNHQTMQKGLWCIAITPGLPFLICGSMASTIFNSFSSFSWWLSLSLNNVLTSPACFIHVRHYLHPC